MTTFRARESLLTTAKAAAYTGLPNRTIRWLADSRRLPFVQLAGSLRGKRFFRASDLDRVVLGGK